MSDITLPQAVITRKHADFVIIAAHPLEHSLHAEEDGPCLPNLFRIWTAMVPRR
jgi:hypothetical protein